MSWISLIRHPWPWYVAGPLIGLMIPFLLIAGNKRLGVSSSLRHICAACLGAGIPFFKYDWKREAWNLFFVGGILAGGFLAVTLIKDPMPPDINPHLAGDLRHLGIHDFSSLMPVELFNWKILFTLKGATLIVIGGFLVGFGTRYAGGCTSGHAIMGLSTGQWPSLIATISFMFGGVAISNFVLPYILKL
jgi:uncharacterized membrane protein YedE/YeeE